jgi:RNA polymerase primary sigma factor
MRQLKITKTITNRDTQSLDKYLSEIGKEDLLTALEEVQLAQKIHQWDQQALEKLVKANLRFVVSVAKQYQNQWLLLPDLINEGNLWLIKAAQRFDERRGFKFISYAVRWIRQSIMQGIAEQSKIIRLPLNQIGAYNKIYKTKFRLEQTYGREPTNDEIAEELELSEEKVEDTILYHGWIDHLDKPIDQEDSGSWTLGDLILKTEEHEAADYAVSYKAWLQKEIERVLTILTERESDILKLYFGIGQTHPHTLEEIGGIFDLHRERIRQIRDKAIRRLKHTGINKHLKQYLG